MKAALLILAVMLTGCAAPKVISSSERSVVVRAPHADQAQQLASAECAKFKLHARMSGRPTPMSPEFLFDCVQ